MAGQYHDFDEQVTNRITLIGIPLLFIPLHVMNFMAEASGWFAQTMLARLR